MQDLVVEVAVTPSYITGSKKDRTFSEAKLAELKTIMANVEEQVADTYMLVKTKL